MGALPSWEWKRKNGEERVLEESRVRKEEKVEDKRSSPLENPRGANESYSPQLVPQVEVDEEEVECVSEDANVSGKWRREGGVTSFRRERQIGGICGTPASIGGSVVVGGAMSASCSSSRLRRYSLPQWLVCHYYYYY